MQKYEDSFKLKYKYEEDGFSISNYESELGNHVMVKYEKEVSVYTCNSNFEAACLVHDLLIEYTEKKKIVEKNLDLI